MRYGLFTISPSGRGNRRSSADWIAHRGPWALPVSSASFMVPLYNFSAPLFPSLFEDGIFILGAVFTQVLQVVNVTWIQVVLTRVDSCGSYKGLCVVDNNWNKFNGMQLQSLLNKKYRHFANLNSVLYLFLFDL